MYQALIPFFLPILPAREPGYKASEVLCFTSSSSYLNGCMHILTHNTKTWRAESIYKHMCEQQNEQIEDFNNLCDVSPESVEDRAILNIIIVG